MDAHVTLGWSTTASEPEAQQLVLRKVEGREAISSLYEYSLELVSPTNFSSSTELLENLLNHRCEVQLGDYRMHGVLRDIELLGVAADGHVSYRATLVPELWRTTLMSRSRIFQGMTVLEIIAAVLREHRLDGPEAVAFQNEHNAYPKLEYVVQYRESDFAFLSRWMEHFGLFYFFLHDGDREKLILGDSSRAFAPLDGWKNIAYAPPRTAAKPSGVVRTLGRQLSVQPALCSVYDFNEQTPSFLPRGSHDVDTATGHGGHHSYGEAATTEAEAKLLAQVRAEEFLARRDVLRGHFVHPGLHPGHEFLLTGHPEGGLDQEYLVTEIHRCMTAAGDAERVYQEQFSLIPTTTRFRPSRVTPKPVIHGCIPAKIDGETAGLEAPVDSAGRYKVVFPFDLYSTPGGQASRWIRMVQPHSGPGYGMHLPLHIGTEVMVAHVHGDVDRPVILGSVPNPETASPVVRDNATQLMLRTRGGSYLQFEDAAET